MRPYTLRDASLHAAVAGVVTMGNPFIYAQNRLVRPFLRSFLKSLQSRMMVMLIVLPLILLPRSTIVHVVMPLSLAVMLLVGSMVIFEMAVLRRTRYSVERNSRKLLLRTLLTWIARSQKDSMAVLAYPRECDVPIFCIQQKGDEAFLLLFLENLLASIPIAVLSLCKRPR